MSAWKSFLKYIRHYRTSFSVWIVLSIFFHTILFKTVKSTNLNVSEAPHKEPIKIKIIPKLSEEELLQKKILEAKLEETKKPDESKFLGHTDHKAEIEQKLKKELLHTEKALDPSRNQKSLPIEESKVEQEAQARETNNLKKIAEKGRKKATKNENKSVYKNLLSDSMQLLSQQKPEKESFKDYISDDLKEGDSIDLSTTKFRYIGYFTNLRKQIEMTWVYPTLAARNGKQGNVFLEFSISKNGKTSKIKVLRSSGYRILDESIVQAIQEASPFAPLPEGISKEELRVTGTFSYVISGYSSY